MANRFWRLLKHRRLDAADAKRLLGPGALERIGARVAASERRHSGQIRVCIEAGLPLSYLRRASAVRERALMMFAKLRVWDTEHNNGVLIYVLLADRAIEVVADRGPARQVSATEWERITTTMSEAFKAGRYETGINDAIDAVDALLATHYPLAPGTTPIDELPNTPYVT